MTNVDATAGSTVNPEWSYANSQAPKGPTNELGKDEFLQLLVAQLKHQDPLNPSSSDEFIATTAQFTVVEKLDELTQQTKNSALVSSLSTAGSLVGREVTANLDGQTLNTVVKRSSIVSGNVMLDTSGGQIRLDQVASVGPLAVSPAASTSASSKPAETEEGDAATDTPQPVEAASPAASSAAVPTAASTGVSADPAAGASKVGGAILDYLESLQPGRNDALAPIQPAVLTRLTSVLKGAGAEGDPEHEERVRSVLEFILTGNDPSTGSDPSTPKPEPTEKDEVATDPEILLHPKDPADAPVIFTDDAATA